MGGRRSDLDHALASNSSYHRSDAGFDPSVNAISGDTPRRVSGPFGARECGSTKWTPLLFLGRKQTPLPGFAPRLRPPTPPTTRPPTPTSATLRMAAEVGSILVPNHSHRRCKIRPASCSFQQLARPRRAGRHQAEFRAVAALRGAAANGIWWIHPWGSSVVSWQPSPGG